MAKRLAQYFRQLARTNLKIAEELEACSERELETIVSEIAATSEFESVAPGVADIQSMASQSDVSLVVLRWIRELNEAYPEPRNLAALEPEAELALGFIELLVKHGFLKGSHTRVELTAAGRMSLIRAAAAERSVYRFLSGESGNDDLAEPHVLLLAVLRSYFEERSRGVLEPEPV